MVIDHYRKKSTKDISLDQTILELQSENSDISSKNNIEEEVGAKIEVEMIMATMDKLKDEYREILILKHVEGFDIGEIARITEKKQGAIRVTLHRANKALQNLLEEGRE